MLAVVLGLFLLIEDDSEFEYCDWKRSKKETGGDLGSGGPACTWRSGWSGRRRWQRWRRRLFRGSGFFVDEDETTEEQASGDGTIQDCPKCPEIVPTKAGRGLIGSTSKVAIKGAELGPLKSVAFGRDFGIGKYEVTVEQFKALIQEAEYRAGKSCRLGAKRTKKGHFPRPGFMQHQSSPVVYVSRKDANQYTDWLSRKTGAEVGGRNRLGDTPRSVPGCTMCTAMHGN